MMYKPNFDTSLNFDRALELLNKLGDHSLHIQSGGEIIEAFVCELNEDTKDYLCQLGVDITEIPDEFYNAEEKYFELSRIV